jgi:hypothetical protein
MSNIGLLFKQFNENQTFNNYIQDLNINNREEILNNIFNDTELISFFKTIVDDETIIKQKMNVKFDQQLKKQKSITNETQSLENESQLISNLNPNAIYITDDIYLEREDHLIKMTTKEWGVMYY